MLPYTSPSFIIRVVCSLAFWSWKRPLDKSFLTPTHVRLFGKSYERFPALLAAAIPQGLSESLSDGHTDDSWAHLTEEKCFKMT